MAFEVGQKAVYPAHGVGIIKEIETQSIEDQDYEFYVLKILDNGMTIRVPLEQASANGMREVIGDEGVERVLEVLKDHSRPAKKQTWNRRYREYMTKIKTGDPLEVAEVLRDLLLLRAGKALSFGERKMFDQAHGLVVQELAVARDVDEAAIEAEIASIFEELPNKRKKKKK